MTDYDLYIYDKDGTQATKQETNSNCLELAEFTASKKGTYKVEIVLKKYWKRFVIIKID